MYIHGYIYTNLPMRITAPSIFAQLIRMRRIRTFFQILKIRPFRKHTQIFDLNNIKFCSKLKTCTLISMLSLFPPTSLSLPPTWIPTSWPTYLSIYSQIYSPFRFTFKQYPTKYAMLDCDCAIHLNIWQFECFLF